MSAVRLSIECLFFSLLLWHLLPLRLQGRVDKQGKQRGGRENHEAGGGQACFIGQTAQERCSA
jgi:hypothetical protein